MKQSFTDIHTHILPSVDDGAQSMEDALELLRLQKNSGVERVMLTPHFYPQHDTPERFLKRRAEAEAALPASGFVFPPQPCGWLLHDPR